MDLPNFSGTLLSWQDNIQTAIASIKAQVEDTRCSDSGLVPLTAILPPAIMCKIDLIFKDKVYLKIELIGSTLGSLCQQTYVTGMEASSSVSEHF